MAKDAGMHTCPVGAAGCPQASHRNSRAQGLGRSSPKGWGSPIPPPWASTWQGMLSGAPVVSVPMVTLPASTGRGSPGTGGSGR